MILSEDCDLKKITQIALAYNFNLIQEYKKVRMGERFYIFRIMPLNS
jgi:hypothetical protein